MNTGEIETLMREVGAFLVAELGKVSAGQIEAKSLNSLVSYVDQSAEQQLVAGLRQILPTATFLTEEETVEQVAGTTKWIIDPLDGTTNFLHQLPCFAISVALEQDGVIVFGAVYEPIRQEYFHAELGKGAFLNGTPMRVSPETQLSECLIATGFPYRDFEWMDEYDQAFRYFMRHTRGVRRWGAAAIDLAYTAAGRFNGFFEKGLAPWDVAAGVLLVTEAGGRVADFHGSENYVYGGELIAGAMPIFAALELPIQQAFAKFID